ncbi:hypothetical protein P8C59_000342 [Phyllachora maydis]|uniref:SET domain-containing protein n=1 Tax=Phyllachora maydis TaxID=1825666 RepID=A0AAD9HX17_9PEZI|nr:hypothetical protein P8C59_000342 [Phyllachora maydis]
MKLFEATAFIAASSLAHSLHDHSVHQQAPDHTHQHNKAVDNASYVNGDGITGDAHEEHPWTHSTPCVLGSTGEELCVFADADFAQGRGIALVTTRERANYLATKSAFTDPQSVSRLNQEDLVVNIPHKYEVSEVKGKGMGMVATDFIWRGEQILVNTASLMVDYRAFESLEDDEHKELQARAADALPEAHRAALLRLSTHVETNLSYVAKVDRVVTTNGFDIDPDTGDVEQEAAFLVLFSETSRANHDCRPNADYYFDHATMAHRIYAMRDISPGEEITISYINTMRPRAERQERLKEWGFTCTCPLCSAPPAVVAASDGRIDLANELFLELQNYLPESRGSPQMAELVISLFEQEKLWSFINGAFTLAALEYAGAGEPWMAIKYASLSLEWSILSAGPDSSDAIDMGKLAKDPQGHWSWMLRAKKRLESKAGGK